VDGEVQDGEGTGGEQRHHEGEHHDQAPFFVAGWEASDSNSPISCPARARASRKVGQLLKQSPSQGPAVVIRSVGTSLWTGTARQKTIVTWVK
jgi:hypothetical protein